MGFFDLSDDGVGESTTSKRLGIVRAEVSSNLDLTGQGRVQLTFPTIPDIEPWAPVCAPFAGDGYGLWCMPQVGDVVIVAFENGDIAWPVVIGSVWDLTNRPPIDLPTDAVTKRVLKTPAGHELVFDDFEQSITMTHLAGHTLTIGIKGVTIELAGGVGSLTLSVPGTVSLTGALSSTVSAKKTSVKGEVTLDLSGATTSLSADATCQVKGGLVTIN
ncbi:MAG: phage baseplate assembly protein V [Mycetocola sp.]